MLFDNCVIVMLVCIDEIFIGCVLLFIFFVIMSFFLIDKLILGWFYVWLYIWECFVDINLISIRVVKCDRGLIL